MKIYRRADGFEVHDANDRGIDWVVQNYGAGFTDVTADIDAAIAAQTAQELLDKETFRLKSRLAEIDALAGPRPVRDYLLSVGFKGAVKTGRTKGVVEEAEQEAATLRGQLNALGN